MMSDYTDARRIDYCDVCWKKVKRDDLRIMSQQYRRAKGSNYFTWSKYHTDLWTCDATDRSTISIGCRADESRVRVSLGNVNTETGVQTWSGIGTFRTSAEVDASSWTSLTFACVVGPYQAATSPSLSVEIGMCLSDGSSGSASKTYSGLTASRECWFTVNVADIPGTYNSSALYFYVTVTPSSTEYWWIDELRLEKDVTVPTQWIRTTGSAVSRTTHQDFVGSGKVCKDCYHELLKTDAEPAEVEPSEPVEQDIESTIL